MIKVIWCWLLKIYVSDRWFPVSYTLRTPGSYPTWPRMNFCPKWTSLFPHLLFPIHWTLNGLLYIWEQVKILEKLLLFCVAQYVFWIQLYTSVCWCSLLSVALSQVYCFLLIWCPIYNFKLLFFFTCSSDMICPVWPFWNHCKQRFIKAGSGLSHCVFKLNCNISARNTTESW